MLVGLLKFVGKQLFFENAAKNEDKDHVTHTSCNTEFRHNKRFLTNLNIKPRESSKLQEGDSLTTYRSSVRDTISKITV